MRALVWDGALRLDDLSLRPAGPGEVRVRGLAAGLCRSDLAVVRGAVPYPTPVVLGHELAGVVDAVGEGVDAMQPGARVVVTTLAPCGRCRRCRAGRPTLCPATAPRARQPLRAADGTPVNQFYNVGAFAEATVVSATQVVPVADVAPEPAAILGCAVLTGTGAAVHRAGVGPGDQVVVIGAGGIGLNAVQGARLAGATRILACDAQPRKEGLVRQAGATDFAVTTSPDEVAAAIEAACPDGADAAIEATGDPDLLAAAVAGLAWGGTAVVVGLPPVGTEVTFPVRALSFDRSLVGCRMGSGHPATDLPWLADRYRAGELLLDEQVSDVVGLAEAPALFAALAAGEVDRGVVWLTS